MRVALLGRILAWATIGLCQSQSQNISDPVDLIHDGSQGISNRAAPVIRSLPLIGAVAVLGPGESHIWDISSEFNDEWRLTVSECSREPLNASPLSLLSGNRVWNTSDGGLAEVKYINDLGGSITIEAPMDGQQWQYEIGAGNASSYSFDLPELYLVDSDFANSLVVTSALNNLTTYLSDSEYADTSYGSTSTLNVDMLQLVVNMDPHLNGSDSSSKMHANPLARSYCAARRNELLNEKSVDVSNTTRGTKHNQLRGQFLIRGLNASSRYDVRLALPPASGGVIGGALFQPISLVTKSGTSCQLIYNMTFCSEMAFNVPGNASAFTNWQLTQLYDTEAQKRYVNFTHALNQINCNTTIERRYSLYSHCDNCADAYKQWLCAVTIPRCEDWSDPASYLKKRPAGQSRNPFINEIIQPGDYKEVLPCASLVFDLVRTCPAALGFASPDKDDLDFSYGRHSDNGDVTCSYPGAVYNDDGALQLRVHPGVLVLSLLSLLVFSL